MILEYYRFSGKDISAYMPFIIDCVKFYDQHHQMYHNLMAGKHMKDNPYDENGKPVFFPSTAGERYPAKKPAEVIAGLTAVTRAVLDLPTNMLTPAQRQYFEKFKARIPALPKKEVTVEGKNLPIFIASEDDNTSNGEVFLHAVYLYNLVVPGTPDFQVVLNSMEHKVCGLFPAGNGVCAARTGNTALAKANVSKQLDDCNEKDGRFPTFWMSGDW